ncbi:MAG: hypothetical protein QOH06_5445 [Acidobacteriota bacterium]|jgi:hypothetical protein|nr:hypothetical protein [Acidobacteriota bacterium]
MTWIRNIIRSPEDIGAICAIYIVSYYVVSAFFIQAVRSKSKGFWRKNGPADLISSVIWFLVAMALTASLIELSYGTELTPGYLILYYFLFIFFFGFCYGLLEWHWEGMLTNVQPHEWKAELQYILFSTQTQAALGYGDIRPGKVLTEVIACLQALLGLFFTIVFIAKAVNKLG